MSAMVPKLRFPEFEGEWQPVHAGDAFRHSKKKGKPGLPIWSVTMDRGLVPRDNLERQMGDDAADGSNLRAQPDDLVYNMMRMWQGAVGIATVECMVSPAYVVLSPKTGICSKFFDYWFKSQRMLHLLGAYSHGLTSDRLRLYFADFAKIPLALPSFDEQQKIANLLDTLTRKISLLRGKKAALEDYKRGLMRRLFSRALRFTRDDGSAFPDWEGRRLGSVLQVEMGQSPASSTYNNLGKGVPLIQGNADILARKSAPRRFTSSPTKLCEIGDILISVRAPIGEISRAMEIACIGRGIAALKPKVGDREFWYQFLLQHETAWRKVGQGSTFAAISGSDIRSLVVETPHLDEQRKIAAALAGLDAKIDAVARKITEMETFRKGLLQKLFV